MTGDSMEIDLPFIFVDDDRHGRRRIYVRRYGRKIRLREQPGTLAFSKAYCAAMDELAAARADEPERFRQPQPHTLGWLATKYFGSEEFKDLDSQSQRTRRGVIEGCLVEPRKPGAPELMRDCPLAALSVKHIKMLRDRKKGKPAAGNNRKKYLSAMFAWAIEADHMKTNPCRDVRRKKYPSKGYHTWTIDEVEQYIVTHPRGTKAHLAVALLLFLGGRPGDTRLFGRQMVKAGALGFVPRKTRHVRTNMSYKPILPVLQEIIDASPCGDLTFLETEFRKPFSAKGFGNKMRQWCDEAGLPHCTAHGLRKAGATILAEMGVTIHQLMAIYDWSTTSQAEVYTRQANRKKLTADALPLLVKGMNRP